MVVVLWRSNLERSCRNSYKIPILDVTLSAAMATGVYLVAVRNSIISRPILAVHLQFVRVAYFPRQARRWINLEILLLWFHHLTQRKELFDEPLRPR